MANLVLKKDSLQMREEIQRQLIENAPKFWENLSALKPKDFCDVYLKMMSFGFAKPPEEKPIDDNTRNMLVLEEKTRRATLIAGGLPSEVAEEKE